MVPAIGTPEGHAFYELNLYVCRQIGEKCFVRVLGDTFEHGIYQIHSHKKNVTLEGEIVNIFQSKTGMMGTIIIRASNTQRTFLIEPDGVNLNTPVTSPTVVTHSSNEIKIARPPRFTGNKKNWEGFILAVDTYLMAYQEEFKEDEQKIWFVISYLGTEDGSQCVASDWL